VTKIATTIARAKAVERTVQQYLWPGTRFAGGAKRPALEQCDLRGEDADGWPLWGEVKSYSVATMLSEGGPYAVLAAAYEQAQRAIEANRQDWPQGHREALGCKVAIGGPAYWNSPLRPRPFAVLWPKGSRRDDQKLVMYELPGWGVGVITLAEFKQRIVDGEAAA
jgi:hypothetical protein